MLLALFLGRGHNTVTALIHAAAQSRDHTAAMEVPGLVPGTDLRPADVLTSALGIAYTALGISICSPDCTHPSPVAKLDFYGHIFPPSSVKTSPTLPIVWSACGRPRQDTLTV